MGLTNIKRKESGFTIVELLIVIVVIAILASISIVAYTGVQTRAKVAKVTANMSLVQKAAEAYYADNSVYPSTTAMFRGTGNVAAVPSSIALPTATSNNPPAALTSGAPDATNGEKVLNYRYTTGSLGGCIFGYDYTNNTYTTPIIVYVGNGSSSNCTPTGTSTTTNGNSLAS